jgi:hypothetical protein
MLSPPLTLKINLWYKKEIFKTSKRGEQSDAVSPLTLRINL